MVYEKNDSVKLTSDGTAVEIIDQTLLPNEVKTIILKDKQELFDAIYYLKVRGAPAIGIFAGYALYVLSSQIEDNKDFLAEVNEISQYLNSSRPTAVNLSWALEKVKQSAQDNFHISKEKALEAMKTQAMKIHKDDISMCKRISKYGLSLVNDGDGILTHCNAGALATSRYGTGLGPLLLGAEEGYNFHVYVDETRPLLQGARLTSYELVKAGVDTTLICDNMAGLVMKQGKIQACFVGCDRVANNGDTANKIGTSSVAILANYYNIPFYVFCPTSTIDVNCENGDDIIIEERCADEIKTMFFEKPSALDEVNCYNPAFDITDSKLITAIVTEKGIFYPPFDFKKEI